MFYDMRVRSRPTPLLIKNKKQKFSKIISLGLIVFLVFSLFNYRFSVSEATHNEVSFATKQDYAVGTVYYDSNNGPVSTDLNGDTYPDIVSVDYNTLNASVLLNDGDGTFAAPVTYAVGENPMNIKTADFDNDNDIDIAVQREDRHVSVLLNNGNGTFAAASIYNVGVAGSTFGITVGDFNQDEFVDIATMSSGTQVVSVLMNNGDGTFAAKIDYSIAGGGFPYGEMQSRDVNNDDYPDIISTQDSKISVLLNNGDGTFAAATYLTITGTTWILVVEDFNNDDYLDVAIDNSDLNIFINNGDGTFAPKVTYAVGASISYIETADFNNDSYLDVTLSAHPLDKAAVLLNNGDGTFSAAVQYTTGTRPESVQTGDFNNDGNEDIVTGNSTADSVSILLGNGDGTFDAKQDFAVGDQPYGLILVDDFDQNGQVDIATNNTGTPDSISILLNNLVLPTIEFNTATGSGAESVTNPAISVELSAASDADVTVDYEVTQDTATGGGVDYTLASGTATITAGNTTGTIPLVIVDDSDVESSETIEITLSSPTSALLGAADTFTYTITDNDVTQSQQSSSGSSSRAIINFKAQQALLVDPTSPTPTVPINLSPLPTTPNAAPAPILTRILKEGMNGPDIKELQQYLNTHGFILVSTGQGSPGNETIYFRAKTKAAVMKLQAAYNLAIDGVVGVMTRALLK